MTNVLVIGSGGREHALAWSLSQSTHIGKLFVAPGNAGTSQIAENIAIDPTDLEGLAQFALRNAIRLTVVGPDNLLALGVVDHFQALGLRIFGPTQAAATIESSKVFAKKLMRDVGIPTAPFEVFSNYSEALRHVRNREVPLVVKADGLALGKGVYVCHSLPEAELALVETMLERVHKDAGKEVVIEDFLEGPEFSIHAFCDGTTSVLLPAAQDHKPIGDEDIGKNTGGMGTIVPLPWVDSEMLREVDEQVVRPVLQALAGRECAFRGLLFPGLKMTPDGLQVLEFNARFGDPETQSYMRLLKTDLLDILEACVDGILIDISVEWHPGFATCVVLASGGYPDQYKTGLPITGINEAEQLANVEVFHAGTSFNGALTTSGGRVLGVTATGDTLNIALDRAYEAAQLIHFEGKYYRNDIGAKALTSKP
ncbi:MAG: phosphoribosylamine--glycine ligase [Patescibacteria group bacterium]